ncbi:DUF3108 domain-containing protein [Flavobacterium taihuense]|uniref:DUF3108 domain-containing protein n=1 Tax=Flavobacterium taihuense TaxID=2857508 RepID=A0ABS6XQZ9_9FLAO|nr:DUF3108 domain-containing protein [Flavobacterium taihuense]MBW4359069.1 DUF3108 domain-containing protein [Flavobacterium taihuense]
MKKSIIFLLVIFTLGFDTQKEEAFSEGEYLKFRVHYGIINAGYATIEVQDARLNNQSVYHVIGKGFSTGMTKFFFNVEDVYESYIDKVTRNPYKFVRKIDEGGYTKNQEGFFNQKTNKIIVKDYKHKTEKSFDFPKNAQDILSSFYYLRNYPNVNKIKPGESVIIDMFFDNEITKFKLKFIGREDIKTKFGLVSTMIFRPLVQSGRIFKEEESLTIWISDDYNKIPIRIKATLLVGSLKADLEEYKGLNNPFKLKAK